MCRALVGDAAMALEREVAPLVMSAKAVAGDIGNAGIARAIRPFPLAHITC